MRTSVADLMPEPLSPLFSTLGIPAHLKQMQPLGKRMTGVDPVLARDYITSINSYAYMNAAIPPKGWWWVITGLIPAYPRLLRMLVPLWRDELHPEYQTIVASKRDHDPTRMSPEELWRESQELVRAAAYYTCGLMFATMGASAGSEGLLTQVYNKFAKQEGDPEATALLMGWNNIPVRSEKSLYDLAMWAKEDDELTRYLLETPTEELVRGLSTLAPNPELAEFAARFQEHLEKFGHIIFQLDFAEPLPRDHPEMLLENIKMYLHGQGSNPHVRQKASEEKRIRTTETMLQRLKGFKRWVFRMALNWGQSMAEVREDALAEIGLAYPKLRELLREIGHRLVTAGAIQQAGDIYWLEKDEISVCVARLERKQALEDLSPQVEKRKEFNRRAKQITPPPMMPMKKRVMGIKVEAFIAHTGEAQLDNVLKGTPTSGGKVTAPACILGGPEDFDQMKPGDVLVAGTTTPAWTPLFAMASAVVTDIGGPLSHGSIVAREYGIPAVMGTGVATRRIQSGQVITVDGTRGEVILETTNEDLSQPFNPPTEWIRPDPKSTYAAGSLAEHLPNPVSPLFATLGLEIANRETDHMWKKIIRNDNTTLIKDGFYHTINGYVYGGFRLSGKDLWDMLKVMVSQMRWMLTASTERWQAALQKFSAVVETWEQKYSVALAPSELLRGVNEIFGAAAEYYTVIQSSTLPSATSSEMVFVPFYNKLVKRKGDPEATIFLLGFDTLPIRAEKSLFDIADWLKGTELQEYALGTSTEALLADLDRETAPGMIPGKLWEEWRERFQRHLEAFGNTAYELDFVNPTPRETPAPLLEAIKMYLEGKGGNPHTRQQETARKREQATRSVLARIGWPRKRWFQKLLQWAQA